MTSEGKDVQGEAAGDPRPASQPALRREQEAAGLKVEDEMASGLKIEKSPEWLIGRVLGGDYRVEGHLGSGGFGDVFRAIQEKTGQLVALKVLKPRYGKGAPSMERQVARFRREMRVCAELHHAHIVRLIDSGETETGLLFSVFEYLPGLTLAELLREKGALTVRTTIELMGQVLDALICAHEKGVIHRDLKPNNIMVSTTGSRPQTTVLDFGISAFLEGMLIDEFISLTMTREILGTPSYAAPEQLRGETPSVKSDLYAWGLVFVECILGRRVFDGASSMEIAHRQLSAEPIALPDRLQKHWLGTLLRWVLEKNVASRAGDATLLMDRLMEKRSLGDLVDANGYFIEGESHRLALVRTQVNRETSTPQNIGSASGGERRQITALCCAISIGRSDAAASPELLDQALRDAQDLCLHVAESFGGFPAGNLGGQVLVYFGFPQASDTDARRSAVVALEMTHELQRRNHSSNIPIEVRIGLHTGIVTTSALDHRTTSPVFGLTPGRAAQLAFEAPANGILVSADTFPYLAQSFELQATTSVWGGEVYRLVAESRAESAGTGRTRAPFVGRRAELGILQAAWERAKEGHGGTVVVLGEAGLGKSRLARELRQSVEETDSRWIEARCLPEMLNSALRPIIDLLIQELSLSGAAPDAGSKRLESSLLDLGLDAKVAMPLLCPWFGLPLIEPYQPLPFSPQKQKALMLGVLVDLVVAIAERHSAPILVEDLHWSDPTTLEYVDLLIKKVAGSRCLLILTARPDVDAKWPEDLVQILQLKSLARFDVQRIVEELSGREQLSNALIEDVVRRADGIPLFVEEIVRFIKDSIPQPTVPTLVAGRIAETPEREVPGRLRDLLTSRLDRLGRAKETAQIAAAIGREFDSRLLASVLSDNEAALLADLEKMVSADVLTRRRHVDGALYMFRHALIRDAAYESLLASSREQIHKRIARALEDHFPQIVESRPELLAHHWAAGEEKRQAMGYAQRAAMQSLGRSAYLEAAAHAQQALGWLDAYDDQRERAETELALNGLLTPALMSTRGWAHEDIRAKVERSQELIETLGSSPHAAPTLWGLIVYHHTRGVDRARARILVERLLGTAERANDTGLLVAALCMAGACSWIEGRIADARSSFEHLLKVYDPPIHRKLGPVYGMDPKVLADTGLSQILWLQGEPDRALDQVRVAIDWSRELGDASALAMSYWYAAMLHHQRREPEKVRELGEAIDDLANRHELVAHRTYVGVINAWATGDVSASEQCMAGLESSGHELGLTYYRTILAETKAAHAQFDEALIHLETSLKRGQESGEVYYFSQIHRHRGEILLKRDLRDANLAEASFREAIRVARAQGAIMPEIEATIALCELLCSRGSKQETRDLLTPLCARFRDGIDLPVLRRARSLLDDKTPPV